MSDILSLINQDLTAEDLEPSLFPDGATVVLEVKSAKIDTEWNPTKQANNNTIVFELATVNQEKTTKGTSFPVGYPFTYNIYLGTVSKKGRDITELVKRNMAQFKQATTGCLGPFGAPENYIGKRLTAVMRIDPPEPPYGKRNSIQRFVTSGS